MRHQEHDDARNQWLNASGDEWMRRNVEEIDHDRTDIQRIGKPRREFDEQYLVDVPRDIQVLEIGSGYGRQLQILVDLGFSHVTGLDINLAGLRRSGLAGVQADWILLPFSDNSFDMVCTSGTLMHVHPSEMRSVVDEIVRVADRWVWCFEQVSARPRTLVFASELKMPPAWLWDLPLVLTMLQPGLHLARGHYDKAFDGRVTP